MEFLRDKRRAQRFYRQLSKVYDTWLRDLFWTEEMRAYGLAMARLRPGMKVLDVGCGTGFLTEGILEVTTSVWGLDLTPEQLRRAARKLPIPLVRGDAENLPFRDARFDAVLSSGSIEYWPDPVQALREMHRVLRPDGVVMVGGPTRPRDRLYRILADNMMLFYDEEEAVAMFEAAGFRGIRVGYTGPKWKPDLAIVTTGQK
ncbi:MAG: methyltransferase domain-containing protein [Thermoplasmata archaeon]|nr:methyltransferase domain-containing protein [Thermoplasmata archaeon]